MIDIWKKLNSLRAEEKNIRGIVSCVNGEKLR